MENELSVTLSVCCVCAERGGFSTFLLCGGEKVLVTLLLGELTELRPRSVLSVQT